MRVSLDILKRDLLALAKNPIALLVVIALLVLPGLYAWYCIIANWDPYANTGSMPIAVVNQDKVAKNNLAGEVNIGKQVTEKLSDNDSIDWRFYDSKDEALNDTKQGIVYATLVMPEDLSKNLVGIFEGSDEKPTIFYYPNEKYNAVATKVTDSAAQTLIQQINQGFSSTVNQKILESAQHISDEVESGADSANKSAIAEIQEAQRDLDKAIASLDDATSTIAGWRMAANSANDALGAITGQLPAISSSLSQSSEQLNTLRTETDAFESKLSGSILSSAAAISDMSAKAATIMNNASADFKTVRADLEALRKSAIDIEELKGLVDAINNILDLVEGVIDGVDQRVSEMNATVQEITGNVEIATSRISGEIMPQLSSGAYALSLSFSELSGAINQFEPQIASLRNVLAETDSALGMATISIADAKALLGTISKNLKGTVDDVGAIGKALEIDQLTKILEIDPDNAGTFVSMPVQMVTEKICPVSNYGTAVAPFYTNLALWVGCFILVSLMKVEVTGFAGATARQRYFGRLLLFVILSLLQSQTICGVDILLGIDCAHPALFMLSGAVCSFAYMNLIYALAKTFRNIGKTLCIFLLIMQVPGSSGMYPIQIMPDFFQFIHPALPFTYGIDAMREALSGSYGLSYLRDLLIMLLIVPGSLIIGLGLRPLMSNLLLMFDEEMNKTGFFASEESNREIEREGMRGMMRALISHGHYADGIEERAWRFSRTYPRWRRLGAIAAFAIPFAMLVIMLPFNIAFNLSTDTKLTVLVIMLIVLLIVQIALIVLEYTHRSIEEETRLIGESLLDGLDLPTTESAPDTNVTAVGMVPATDGLHAHTPQTGPARDIFLTDLKLGFQSVIGVVVIVLLTITPSMYAWFNIAGSWDPYSATGNLKVAVANEDEGYKGELIPVTINIGNTIEAQLRGNSNFDWVFVDNSEEAIAGVESSEYYAAIVIPSSFSTNMLTYLTEDSDYPNVVYYTNQKENPIAPIITQKGADSIQESIRISFTERIDQVALGVTSDLLEYVKSPNMSSYVTKMSRHLDDATADTKSASAQTRALGSLMKTTSSIVSQLGAALDGMKGAADSAKAAVNDAKAGAQNASAAFDEAIATVQNLLSGSTFNIERVKAVIDLALGLLDTGVSAMPPAIDDQIAIVELIVESDIVSAEVKEKARVLLQDLQAAKAHAESAVSNVANARAQIDTVINDAQAQVDSSRTYFNDVVAPSVAGLQSSLETVSASTSNVVSNLDGALVGVRDSTGGLTSQLAMLSDGLAKAGEKLENTATRIEGTKKRVADALKSGDLKQIEEVIMGSDSEIMAASLASPIKLQREAFYPSANFGSAMAPFYTVLSLWVGALVMISTMRVRVSEERIEELRQRYPKLRPRHEFFGRYGIFGFIGLLQSALVLLGDVLLLHIQCANPVMFFLCGLFIGQVFCLIVYTITELFGDVGKAVCVILLIMQVAASGGTFPVQMLDPLLKAFVPFMPFYHGMTMLQECVGGINWTSLVSCIGSLLAFAGIVLALGVPFRKPFRKLNVFFEEQLEKTGYM